MYYNYHYQYRRVIYFLINKRNNRKLYILLSVFLIDHNFRVIYIRINKVLCKCQDI